MVNVTRNQTSLLQSIFINILSGIAIPYKKDFVWYLSKAWNDNSFNPINLTYNRLEDLLSCFDSALSHLIFPFPNDYIKVTQLQNKSSWSHFFKLYSKSSFPLCSFSVIFGNFLNDNKIIFIHASRITKKYHSKYLLFFCVDFK